MGKRTGFVLATIHQGTSLAMWKMIAAEAEKRSQDALFVFPCGRLEETAGGENLRGGLLSLVNKDNLDSVIFWGSSLTGKVGTEEVATLIHEKVDSGLPAVAVGLTVPGIPSVDFNAYSGVFNEVCHLVKAHGAKKIAFLRGPASHPSAAMRYKAYQDALASCSLDFNERLVSSAFGWDDGEKAIRELMEERGLVPGIDFDSLVAPSDLMLLWATKYLESKGVSIPLELKTVGFNDSEENSVNSVETTTVKMPIKGLATASYSLSRDIVTYPKEMHASIVLPTDLILRRSCGCPDSFGGIENAKNVISDWESLSRWLSNRIENETAVKALVELLEKLYVHGWYNRHEGPYPIVRLLDKYYANGGKPMLLFESFDLAEKVFKADSLSLEDRELIHYLSIHYYTRSINLARFEARQRNVTMDHFKMELLAVSSIEELLSTMKSYLPAIGVRKGYIALLKDEKNSIFAGGFEGQALVEGGVEFPSNEIIDEAHVASLESGVFTVLPLIYNNLYMGHMVLQASSKQDGLLLEDIRSVVSASLKGIELFSLARDKSYAAESAERQSQDFYAKISEGLRGPLKSIQQMAEGQSLNREELRNSATAALHLLELSLAERGELSLSKRLVPGEELSELINHKGKIIIEEPMVMPAIEIDRRVFSEIFDILFEIVYDASEKPRLKIIPKGESMEFRLSGKWDESILDRSSSMLYAEKLVLMHAGSFSFSSDSIILNFPYPSLSGALSIPSKEGKVVYIKLSKNESLSSLIGEEVVIVTEDELFLQGFKFPEDATSVIWDVRTARPGSKVVLNLLRSHVNTRDLPFLCFGLKGDAANLYSALEGTMEKDQKAIIYSFGLLPDPFKRLKEFATVIELDTFDEAEGAEGEGTLVLVYDLPVEGVAKLRGSKRFSRTPIVIVKETFTMEDAEMLADVPNVLMANTSILESEDFMARILGVFGGSELLPPLTSALVKKSIAFLNKNASTQISRWQLAAAVNISEDYLTRIFRRETGISPWDYLNRYRIQLASRLLTQTGYSINEIAKEAGFQDQAYFCRVFKKVKGYPPGKIRQRS